MKIRLTESELVNLVKRIISEQPAKRRNIYNSIETGDIFTVKTSDNKTYDIRLTSVQPKFLKGVVGNDEKEIVYVYGPRENQIIRMDSQLSDVNALTVITVDIDGRKFNVDSKGDYEVDYSK